MKSVVRSLVRRFSPNNSRLLRRAPTRRATYRPCLNVLEERNLLTTFAWLLTFNTTVDENAGYAEFTIVVVGGSDDPITVDYSITGGAATPGDDVDASGSLTFQPWESYRVVSVAITDDNTTEDDEDFYLELANSVNAEIYNTGQGIILANDRPPELGSIGDLTVEEQTTLYFSAGATDPDSPGETLAYSLDSGAPSGASIDPNTGYFTWTPTEEDGPDTFPLTVFVTETSGAGLSDSETITITVLEMNIAPESWGIADVYVDEDAAPTTIDLFGAFEDAEDTDAQMSYSVVDNSDPSLFSDVSVDGTSGQLMLAYEANANGGSWIAVRATDSLGAWVDQYFYVNVAPVNDAPVISGFGGSSLPDDAWEFSGSVTDIDNDVTGSQVTFGGMLDGYTAYIEYGGSFSLFGTWPGLSGTAIVTFTDANGATSNVASWSV